MRTTRRQHGLTLLALGLALAAGSLPAHATDSDDAQRLVKDAEVTLRSMAGSKQFASLHQALGTARGVFVFPRVLKAGFVLGGAGGSGVLFVRDDKGGWSNPAFYTVGGASLGLQAGASSAEVVLVVKTQKALDALYTSRLKLGADASIALGTAGRGKGSSITADIVAYSRVKGAFAGVSLDGDMVDVRESLNTAFYGMPATPVDILVKHTVATSHALPLQTALAALASGD